MILIRRLKLTKPHLLPLPMTTTTTTVSPPTPVDQNQLVRVCTILYQQQNSPDSRLHPSLSSCTFNLLTHEFFLQVCNSFPYSWRPVYRFFLYTLSDPLLFSHTSISFNKMLDVISKSRNIDLFWKVLQDMAKRGLVNHKTFRIALKTLASVRELKKCVEFFHLMNGNGFDYSLDTLNVVLETLCKDKLVEEAKYVVLKLKEFIKPSEVSYGWLVMGFCEMGDLIEAAKVWNLMVEEGLEPGVQVFEKMMETLFKKNRYEAMKVFRTVRLMKKDNLSLSSYKLVIDWMCKKGKVPLAYMLFGEMLKRGFEVDDFTLASLIDGLLSRGRVREAYKIVGAISRPQIGVYHALIKGFLRLKRASEATQVFREMIRRGCEPTMHTYIMLLQAHLGKRGRKGPNPEVNFDTIFVGGLIKAGKSLEATKYVERSLRGGVEVPRFDYNKFLHYYSTEEGTIMFEEVGKKLREVGLVDLADILQRYGEKMATRERRRERPVEP